MAKGALNSCALTFFSMVNTGLVGRVIGMSVPLSRPINVICRLNIVMATMTTLLTALSLVCYGTVMASTFHSIVVSW